MDYREEPPTHYQYTQYFPHHRTPPMLKTLIIINVAVFCLQLLIGLFGGAKAEYAFTTIFGLLPNAVLHGFVWQFVTSAFLHGGIMHILLNMFFLWMFGRELEPALGSRRFLVFYLTAAVFSGILFLVFDYFQHVAVKGHEYVPCIGASGAVMAVAMAFALYWPNRIILFMFFIPMRIRTFIILVAVMETLGLLELGSNIAHMAHLGGLLWGYLFVRYAWTVQSLLDRRSSRAGAKSAYGYDPDDDRRLNQILDKINRRGIQSLTWSEKRFLKKMSRR